MKKQLRKPENWQDFESLCKKLWGEIWNCKDTIKKNGRLGQPQKGVDIYGIPAGRNKYWGIQCKGKDEYTHVSLTEKEIDTEIEKAIYFKPPLESFIFASTANKDAKIEEYVRAKNIEYKSKGIFSIEIFFWEDLVDLIEENRSTYNWYLNNQLYYDNFDVDIYLDDFTKELSIKPIFKKYIKKYIYQEPKKIDESEFDKNIAIIDNKFSNLKVYQGLGSLLSSIIIPEINIKPISTGLFGPRKIYHSWCNFEIIINNTGNKVIEDYYIIFKFDGKYNELTDHDHENIYNISPRNTYCKDDTIIFRQIQNKPLIQKSNTFFKVNIRPLPEEYEIPIIWHLYARDFDKEGILKLFVKPEYREQIENIIVNDKSSIKEDEIKIEEIIEYE